MSHLGKSQLAQTRPLFNFVENGKEVVFSHKLFVDKLKATLLLAGLDPTDISCHSFRRGGATLAFTLGLSTSDIKLRGDWQSSAYERYLCISTEANLSSARTLSLGLVTGR